MAHLARNCSTNFTLPSTLAIVLKSKLRTGSRRAEAQGRQNLASSEDALLVLFDGTLFKRSSAEQSLFWAASCLAGGSNVSRSLIRNGGYS